LAYRGLKIAIHAPDLFGTYLAYGITCLLALSAFINIGVVLDLLPTKGLALPFISYGGSSLLASCIGIGILLNISSQSLKGKNI
jgi:cell division protein FtsW